MRVRAWIRFSVSLMQETSIAMGMRRSLSGPFLFLPQVAVSLPRDYSHRADPMPGLALYRQPIGESRPIYVCF